MKKYTDVQRQDDYKAVFDSSPTGRRVLSDILAKANVLAPIEDADPIVSARKEGARALALHIASFVAFPKKYWPEAVLEAAQSLESE